MTARSHQANESTGQGRYRWYAENLLTATHSVQGYWWCDGNTIDDAMSLPSLSTLCAERIITDTRRIQAGDIFLALSGENFDGHDFVASALQQGAVAVIVEHPIEDISTAPQLVVSDSRLAFGQLAAYRRQQHPNLKVIAITGSSGKTTCKEMLGCIFNQNATATPTLITQGNLNNDLGVPMTLLELTDVHRYAVIELGANHRGEIAYTTQLVQPDVACVLNVGSAHLGEFGGRDVIAQTKAEIYQSLNQSGIAIIPMDDDYADVLYQQASQFTSDIRGFGWHHLDASTNAQLVSQRDCVSASEVQLTATGSTFVLQIAGESLTITLPLVGAHNVSNALAVASCADALGISLKEIASGLSQVQPTKGRLARVMLGRHCLIDDTYNANPHSVRAAAAVLAGQTGHKVMVLGDIAELGASSVAEHQQLGVDIAQQDIDALLCVGEMASHTASYAKEAGLVNSQAFKDKQTLFSSLQAYIQAQQAMGQCCTVLFKGSRSMTMETIIQQLIDSDSVIDKE
ncbi:UDP-N-acetylmuramoyl-tripeptide--D-alanyl-D-alanine ligase [Psychrobacter sp. I-STPA6b]|uniref:UDP-N-acetylmuramoyl-tripeptide--D-alanyl-D- alanine ligase n=1 Tax=Psychrobacter sp. I-STPA6b TaxID=2585718 RepID=UPI001D0C399F|nr:UDP-N-acetylmuramoyl-tripeptide--D-alanyl-D-alanine ligase [Psychrobacter sp. I-STPA6b]